jgi:serine protease Do
MARTFALVTVLLTATVAFIMGLIAAGSFASAPSVSQPEPASAVAAATTPIPVPVVDGTTVTRQGAGLVNFADVAERINPAVVNIEATTRGDSSRRRRQFETPPLDEGGPDRQNPLPVRPQSGSGFVIDSNGIILTNYHVIQGAERIVVKFSNGRSLPAHVVGIDPDTDIALVKVEATGLQVAPLGNSESLRVGEWVCAIGNPLAYEHTVTVGVVSYLGRKLFDSSLDNYIQTDAAINFGNSGGPLINGKGEVVGINSAISQRASNIGFAVPINEATAILPQLKAQGRVSRGYMGVGLTDIDPDLQQSLKLRSQNGAIVQDVSAGSPGERAGLRPYDLITGIDGKRVANNNEIIREVARREPGTITRLQVTRNGREQVLAIRLGERPSRQVATPDGAIPSASPGTLPMPLGLGVRDLDPGFGEAPAPA